MEELRERRKELFRLIHKLRVEFQKLKSPAYAPQHR